MVVRVASVRVQAIWIGGGISVDQMLAMILEPSRAVLSVRLEAGQALRFDANTVTDFDALLDVLADADSFADNLVADTVRVRRAPARA